MKSPERLQILIEQYKAEQHERRKRPISIQLKTAPRKIAASVCGPTCKRVNKYFYPRRTFDSNKRFSLYNFIFNGWINFSLQLK